MEWVSVPFGFYWLLRQRSAPFEKVRVAENNFNGADENEIKWLKIIALESGGK